MKPKVLLVEDQPSVRDALSKVLRAEDYDVALAADNGEALDILVGGPTPFDFVLSDLAMPLRDGWARIKRLLEIKPSLLMIILTGTPHQRDLAERSRVRALVEKPIDVPALLRLMRELLAEVTGRQPNQPPRQANLFHYVPAFDLSADQRQDNPYSTWGINE